MENYQTADIFLQNNTTNLQMRYIKIFPLHAKIYLTGLRGKDIISYFKDENCGEDEIDRRYKILNSVADFKAGKKVDEFYDFLLLPSESLVVCLVPSKKKKKILVSNMTEAKNYGVLRSYFGSYDWLSLCSDEESSAPFSFLYFGDYDKYLNLIPIEKKIEHYLRWMRENAFPVAIYNNDYSSPLYFVDYFFKQLAQYIDILRNYKDREIYIIGDGPGTASIACRFLGLAYYSYEPNKIGYKARQLGIISSDIPGEIKKNDLVFIANVSEFIDYDDFIDYERVIVDFSCKEVEDMISVASSRGSVHCARDIVLMSFPKRSRCLGLLRGKNVIPKTPLAKAICNDNGINIGKEEPDIQKNYYVTTDPYDDEMNVISMEKPSDSRAHKGHMKKKFGTFFVHYDDGQQIFFDDGFDLYYSQSYKKSRYVTDYYMEGNLIHAHSPRPEKVRGIQADDGRITRLFYLYSYESEGKMYGVYRSLSHPFDSSL
jgi:hypothetical protein